MQHHCLASGGPYYAVPTPSSEVHMNERDSPGDLGDALTEIVADHDQQKQAFVDPERMIGDVIQIDYTTADFEVYLTLRDKLRVFSSRIGGCAVVVVWSC